MPAPAFLVLWQLSGVVALRSWGPLLGEGAGGAKTRAERPAAARAAAAAAAAVAISWPAVRPRVGIPPDPCCCCLLPPAAADLRSVLIQAVTCGALGNLRSSPRGPSRACRHEVGAHCQSKRPRHLTPARPGRGSRKGLPSGGGGGAPPRPLSRRRGRLGRSPPHRPGLSGSAGCGAPMG
jgi:hypothetical protein